MTLDRIGTYVVEKSVGDSVFARGDGGLPVVLKPLPEGCLSEAQLHPFVHDRLGRIRELAHVGVAQLYGVEKLNGKPYLVWERLAGRSLEEAFRERPDGAIKLGREILGHVDLLHQLGIVHGALHARNVILMPDGSARLTHISPLLHQDEAEDIKAMGAMLLQMGLPVDIASQTRLVDLSRQLRDLSQGAAEGLSQRRRHLAEAARGRRVRRLSAAGALAAVAAGVVIAWALWWTFGRGGN
jgi:serine/threonine protein kinase